MPPKLRIVVFRVTTPQYERIITTSRAKGYIRLADYLRFLALDKGALVEHKILENNKLLHKLKEFFKIED